MSSVNKFLQQILSDHERINTLLNNVHLQMMIFSFATGNTIVIVGATVLLYMEDDF